LFLFEREEDFVYPYQISRDGRSEYQAKPTMIPVIKRIAMILTFDYRKRIFCYVNNFCMCGGILSVFARKVYAVHRAMYKMII
ncbi:MAG: hypothetical protein WBM07_07450, partial [Chitinivibrionales bacterium]